MARGERTARWLGLLIAVVVVGRAGAAHADPFVYMDREGNLHTMQTASETDPSAAAEPLPDTPPGGLDFPFADIVDAAARRYDLPVALVRAVVSVESGFQPLVVSSAGARGLMQLMPKTADDLGVRDVFDPEENIAAGARQLRTLLDIFDGDVALALAAYNAGASTVQRARGIPAIPETQRYVSLVLGRYQRWREPPPVKAAPIRSVVAVTAKPARATRSARISRPAVRARVSRPEAEAVAEPQE